MAGGCISLAVEKGDVKAPGTGIFVPGSLDSSQKGHFFLSMYLLGLSVLYFKIHSLQSCMKQVLKDIMTSMLFGSEIDLHYSRL